MKNLILILFSLISFSANALFFNTIKSSMDDSSSIHPGSIQWMDLQPASSYSSSDYLEIWILQTPGTGSSANFKMFSELYWTYWPTVAWNTDGISKRIYFTIPSNFVPGTVDISANLGTGAVSTILEPNIVAGIFSPINNKEEKTLYYNEQGIEILKPENGFYIWKSSNGQSGKSFMLQ